MNSNAVPQRSLSFATRCSVEPPYRILAVDDSEDDLFFLQWAIKRRPNFTCVGTLSSGKEAVAFFRREPPYSDLQKYPEPHLVLLDLKMPGTDGFRVLEELRPMASKRRFLVIVFTSSDAPDDKHRSKALGADDFRTKPADHLGYVRLLDDVHTWINRGPTVSQAPRL